MVLTNGDIYFLWRSEYRRLGRESLVIAMVGGQTSGAWVNSFCDGQRTDVWDVTGIWAHYVKRRSVSHSCGNAGIDAYFTYIYFLLSSWRRFWIFIRSFFLSGKYHLQCVILTIWSLAWYRHVLSSLTCFCLWNFLSLPVALSNVGSVSYCRCCKPNRSRSNQSIVYSL